MSKKLRRDPIYIAPEIIGWLDENGDAQVLDERNGNTLDPRNIDDKITIYERQVCDWFLLPATNLIKYKKRNKGFIVLMICLSYLEGIEQYRRGKNSRGNSRNFFVSAIKRIYPNKYQDGKLNDFYSQARCGLFHNGMVKGKIIISNSFQESLEFIESDIKVNPRQLLEDIKLDFHNFIQELKLIQESQRKFDQMYSNI